jgi:hypothetical protein
MEFDAAAFTDATFEPATIWLYWPKRGWRRWLAWALRRSQYDVIRLDLTSNGSGYPSSARLTARYDATGLLWLDDERTC